MSSKTYDLSAVHGADLAILKEIDRICEQLIRGYGCIPSFLN